MAKDYMYQQEDGRVVYNATLSNIYGDNRIPPEMNGKNFQDIVVVKNGEEFCVKVKVYNQDFNILTEYDKQSILKKMAELFNGNEVEIKADGISGFHVGEIILTNSHTYNLPAQNFNEILSKEIIRVLREEKLNVKGKIIECNSVDNILIDYKGKVARLRLDLYDTSYEKMNKTEKISLNRYLQSRIKIGGEVDITVTGSIGKSWFGQLDYKVGSLKTQNINDEIKTLIDVMPEFKVISDRLDFQAIVSSVPDGDTIKIYKNGKRISLRMDGIDSPEKEQAFGMAAKQTLIEMIPSRVVRATSGKYGHFNRLVATVYSNFKGKEINCNEQQVKKGMAYATDDKYKNIEREANANFKGLWASKPTEADLPKNYRERMKETIKKRFEKKKKL
jgi:endonuclease YncB( thermonuclease family)